MSPQTAKWVKSSGPVDYQTGIQVPKAALLHAPVQGPPRVYTPDQRRQLTSFMSSVSTARYGRSTVWLNSAGLRPENRISVQTLLNDKRTFRMLDVSQTLTSTNVAFTNRWDHGVVVGWVGAVIAMDSGFGDPLHTFMGGWIHDIGHPPHHHSAEEVLDEKATSLGLKGFQHAKRGSAVLLDIAEAIPGDRRPLAVLATMAETHSWPLKPASSLEAAYITMGDRIGYVATDLADGLLGGVVTTGQVSEMAPYGIEYLGLNRHPAFRTGRTLSGSEVKALKQHIAYTFATDCAQQMRNRHYVGLSLEGAVALAELRSMNSTAIITRGAHLRWQENIREVHGDVATSLMKKAPRHLDEPAAFLHVVDQVVSLTESEFVAVAERELLRDLSVLRNSPLVASTRKARQLRSAPGAELLSLDELIPVDVSLPTVDGRRANLRISQAFVVSHITLSKYPQPVKDAEGRPLRPYGQAFIAIDPAINPNLTHSSGDLPMACIELDGIRGKGKARHIASESLQGQTAHRTTEAIVEAFRCAATEFVGSSPTMPLDNPRRAKSLEKMFGQHGDVCEALLSDERNAITLLPAIERMCQDYSLVQRSIAPTAVFDDGPTFSLAV